jgi:hypothetical protein
LAAKLQLPLVGGFECHVLLGRTFLRRFEFTYHGPTGRAVISHPA